MKSALYLKLKNTIMNTNIIKNVREADKIFEYPNVIFFWSQNRSYKQLIDLFDPKNCFWLINKHKIKAVDIHRISFYS